VDSFNSEFISTKTKIMSLENKEDDFSQIPAGFYDCDCLGQSDSDYYCHNDTGGFSHDCVMTQQPHQSKLRCTKYTLGSDHLRGFDYWVYLNGEHGTFDVRLCRSCIRNYNEAVHKKKKIMEQKRAGWVLQAERCANQCDYLSLYDMDFDLGVILR